MPILSDLSRRLHLLTTDARPDPPRIPPVEDNTSNVEKKSSGKNQKSEPVTPSTESHEEMMISCRRKSEPNQAVPLNSYTGSQDFSNSGSSKKSQKEAKTPKGRTFPRFRSSKSNNKTSQTANVVNYNIVNSNGVKIGSKTCYVCNINQFTASPKTMPEESSSKATIKPMPNDVEELSQCKDEITTEDMLIIKNSMGHGWRDVARSLGFGDGKIEQFQENHLLKGVDEVIYQMLLDWKQANTKDAQVGRLVCVMWSCSEYDCVQRLVAAKKNT